MKEQDYHIGITVVAMAHEAFESINNVTMVGRKSARQFT
jgi:hypothetical protein